MNTNQNLAGLLAAALFLCNISAAQTDQPMKLKKGPESAGINGADSALRQPKNNYVAPYIPNDLTSVDWRGAKQSVMCTETGLLEPGKRLSGSCLDYRSPSEGTLWRVRFSTEGRQGGFVERVFQLSGNSPITWVVFDTRTGYEGNAISASVGAERKYVASKGHERAPREPETANGNNNRAPAQGLPNVGGVPLDTIVNEILKKQK